MRPLTPGLQSPFASGVGRVADNEKALIVYFYGRPTDEEMRRVHTALSIVPSDAVFQGAVPTGERGFYTRPQDPQPTPWVWRDRHFWSGRIGLMRDGRYHSGVAVFFRAGDAEFALRAANAHDDLVEALEAYEGERDDLEDRAPVDPGCGDCNLGTGPHKRTCAHHLAVAALTKAKNGAG